MYCCVAIQQQKAHYLILVVIIFLIHCFKFRNTVYLTKSRGFKVKVYIVKKNVMK